MWTRVYIYALTWGQYIDTEILRYTDREDVGMPKYPDIWTGGYIHTQICTVYAWILDTLA